MRVWLLGGCRVSVGSRIIEDKRWRLRRAATLEKLLALAPGHRLRREQVMDLLWPDLGRKAVSNNLRQALYAARKILGCDQEMSTRYLASEEESLVLCPGGQLWVDVEAFEEAAATARRSRDSAAYGAALDMYAGELLPDDRYEEWAHDWREQLRREYLELLVELAGLYEERGEYRAAIQARRRVVVEEPMNEEASADLMRAYVLSGRPAEALAVVEVCRRLDGIPLAIELVTGRVAALAVQQVAERIEDSLSLLISGPRAATPRHQTMRATIEWSYALLSEHEQALFNRLSVFVGGWTLEAAETVGAGDSIEGGDVLDLLCGLVDKSLLVAEPQAEGASRYRMLEPVREYAREKLQESRDAVRYRHLLWCLTLAEQAEPELKGARQKKWLERLEREHDNLQVALGWVLERDVGTQVRIELAARLVGALWPFWYKRGHLAGMVAWERGDYAAARPRHEESLRLHRQANDKPGIAFSLNHLGLVALYQGDHGSAEALLEEGLILQQELEDTAGKATALHNLGLLALYRGDYEPARSLIEESLSLFRELEHQSSSG